MSQTSGEKSGQPATERAEELLDSMGRRLGFFAALAGRRIRGRTPLCIAGTRNGHSCCRPSVRYGLAWIDGMSIKRG